MMKNRVNLYSASLLPIKVRLNFTRLCFTLGGTLLLSMLISAIISWQSQGLMTQINNAQYQADELNSQKTTLEASIAARQPNQALVREFELAEQRLQLKKALKGELLQRNAVVTPGYSQLLTELAAASDASIWLSRISVQEQVYEFEGFGQAPQSIPQWVERLKASRTLKGYAFSSLTLERGENMPLAFKLSSKPLNLNNAEAK
ncbi:PilN domain-containing protein [Shewanella sp. SR44-3]|uniref:PilN domain-containing protein n=1 Tax=unclassified Shewanella TaxID=196818 RepID=UPI0015FBB5A2|nr:PilN domain-containing protein [Shewanella sp. SR44-3]MBB1269637.1 PilN domain-containing protein [Shewanella sp. SR44-3]